MRPVDEKRCSALANIAGIKSISIAIWLRFGKSCYYYSSNYYSWGRPFVEIGGSL